MRFLVVFLFSIFIFNALISKADAPDPISTIVEQSFKTDVLMWGELHEEMDQSMIFIQFLKQAQSAHLFNVILTEYVPRELNEEFQMYLANPNATAGSEFELLFFDQLAKESFTWASTESGRMILRTFRELRQADPTLVIAGIELRPKLKDGETYAQNLWQNLPSEFKDLALKRLGQNELTFLEDKEGVSREIAMAFEAQKYVFAVGRVLIHVGAFHAIAPDRFPEGRRWRPMGDFLKLFLPDRSWLSLFNTVQFRSGGAIEDQFKKFASSKKLNELTLMTSAELSQQSDLKYLFPDGTSLGLNLWDLYLLRSP